jgi:hypothetical protein
VAVTTTISGSGAGIVTATSTTRVTSLDTTRTNLYGYLTGDLLYKDLGLGPAAASHEPENDQDEQQCDRFSHFGHVKPQVLFHLVSPFRSTRDHIRRPRDPDSQG